MAEKEFLGMAGDLTIKANIPAEYAGGIFLTGSNAHLTCRLSWIEILRGGKSGSAALSSSSLAGCKLSERRKI
ncbi:MAG: hypothetical protein ACON4W_03775 [Parvibaculales bacterium]